MTTKKERHIRWRAVKAKDELFYDGAWWKVIKRLNEGDTVTVGDRNHTDEVVISAGWTNRTWLLLERGSIKRVAGGQNAHVAKVMRPVPVKA